MQIGLVLEHVRTFCAERGWPRGDLNLPRPFVTEKAFPENEAVLTTSIVPEHESSIGNQFLYEHRVGRRGQYEVFVPFDLHESSGNGWQAGIGDIGAAYKHVVYDSLPRGSILSLGGELSLPTGSASKGFGKGVAMFEAFGTVSQVLPRDGFLHAHTGIEVPADAEQAAKETFWRIAIGKSFMQNRWGRAWSPMVELLGARELRGGQRDGVGRAAAAPGEPQHAAARAAQCRRAHADLAAIRAADERARLSAVGLVRRRIPVRMVVRALVVVCVAAAAASVMYGQRNPHTEIFATSDQCLACHNGLRTPAGEDVSIGASWRASMMANSSRDPYWQAGVRREVVDHPAAAEAIQDECATCHMPMSRTEAHLNGDEGAVFNHLPVTGKGDRSDRLAHDGVACSICHQITDRISARPPASPEVTSLRLRDRTMRFAKVPSRPGPCSALSRSSAG